MMKRLEIIGVVAAIALTMTSCGNKQQQQQQYYESDSTYVSNINRDSTVYGICGQKSAMNSLELLTDMGDTLMLSLIEAKDQKQVFGGYAVGDRMAVMLKNDHVAKLVINLSTLLGNWVMPNPIDGSSEMGIAIKEGGIAESIEQSSVIYKTWRIFNGKLEIFAQRDGGGDEEEIYLYDITKLTADSLTYVLPNANNDGKRDFLDGEEVYEYSRQQERKVNMDIKLEQSSFDDFKI
jgi:hypothetical protein